MKRKKLKKLIKNERVERAVYFSLSIILMLFLWWILSVALKDRGGVLPSPKTVFSLLGAQFSRPVFWRAVYSTFKKGVISFFIAFALGTVMAVGAKLSTRLGYMFEPLITVLRSVPTLGVTFILFMFYPGSVAAVIIAFLITMPVVYANLSAALLAIDPKLTEMARVYKIPRLKRLTGIYLPSVTPYIFASLISGFGLSIKIIIASEIIAVPRMSVGSYLHGAYVSGDFAMLFVWVLTAVLISFLSEAVIKLVMRLCMPFKYSTRRSLKRLFCAIFRKKKGTVSRDD